MEMMGHLRFAESLKQLTLVFAHIQRVGFRFDEYAVKMRLKEKKPSFLNLAFLNLAPRPGLEPGTCGLTVRRSTD